MKDLILPFGAQITQNIWGQVLNRSCRLGLSPGLFLDRDGSESTLKLFFWYCIINVDSRDVFGIRGINISLLIFKLKCVNIKKKKEKMILRYIIMSIVCLVLRNLSTI